MASASAFAPAALTLLHPRMSRLSSWANLVRNLIASSLMSMHPGEVEHLEIRGRLEQVLDAVVFELRAAGDVQRVQLLQPGQALEAVVGQPRTVREVQRVQLLQLPAHHIERPRGRRGHAGQVEYLQVFQRREHLQPVYRDPRRVSDRERPQVGRLRDLADRVVGEVAVRGGEHFQVAQVAELAQPACGDGLAARDVQNPELREELSQRLQPAVVDLRVSGKRRGRASFFSAASLYIPCPVMLSHRDTFSASSSFSSAGT